MAQVWSLAQEVPHAGGVTKKKKHMQKNTTDLTEKKTVAKYLKDKQSENTYLQQMTRSQTDKKTIKALFNEKKT